MNELSERILERLRVSEYGAEALASEMGEAFTNVYWELNNLLSAGLVVRCEYCFQSVDGLASATVWRSASDFADALEIRVQGVDLEVDGRAG